MRILLVGEYSRLHNSLKEGLVKIGHDVFLLSRGDGFKNTQVIIVSEMSYYQTGQSHFSSEKHFVNFFILTSLRLK